MVVKVLEKLNVFFFLRMMIDLKLLIFGEKFSFLFYGQNNEEGIFVVVVFCFFFLKVDENEIKEDFNVFLIKDFCQYWYDVIQIMDESRDIEELYMKVKLKLNVVIDQSIYESYFFFMILKVVKGQILMNRV